MPVVDTAKFIKTLFDFTVEISVLVENGKVVRVTELATSDDLSTVFFNAQLEFLSMETKAGTYVDSTYVQLHREAARKALLSIQVHIP